MQKMLCLVLLLKENNMTYSEKLLTWALLCAIWAGVTNSEPRYWLAFALCMAAGACGLFELKGKK
jgi:hypothetical protein